VGERKRESLSSLSLCPAGIAVTPGVSRLISPVAWITLPATDAFTSPKKEMWSRVNLTENMYRSCFTPKPKVSNNK